MLSVEAFIDLAMKKFTLPKSQKKWDTLLAAGKPDVVMRIQQIVAMVPTKPL